ncbi:hypothetical protein TVAG_067200 [Trichomonas vaginalis G3]|uniref:Mediator of RNA polymerase II transcription subunit 8 n=1 Tax=Trichomonas vaginalis (strain ATCC PRA-98 / G3) TaxID=412133 RepID=A2DSD6_TRIV3|nr:hypothetical protein TVAGG3_0079610 [Trichomonas vaginalis G3]EAY16715.1 hypothetical protein TVAG_067200 [Trichomonas vaginalis G3]KAI5543149.1 hypothetical protein TVAGG3_0079610 [Trichomonas vaginalis G3]|eukprot:XP_001328938.1 hypothetical protein [Trichomonas vaginalis G3]
MEVEQNLNAANETLKKIQKNLQPTILEPAHLEWKSYLEKMNQISELYGELINQISPELKRTITFPTKFDVFDTTCQNNELSQLELPSDYVNEQSKYSQLYAEYLEQAGLNESSKEMRLNEIKNNISAHNDAISECQEKIREVIQNSGLSNINTANTEFKSVPKTKFQLFDYIDANDSY